MLEGIVSACQSTQWQTGHHDVLRTDVVVATTHAGLVGFGIVMVCQHCVHRGAMLQEVVAALRNQTVGFINCTAHPCL
jgi:hypothetical protein